MLYSPSLQFWKVPRSRMPWTTHFHGFPISTRRRCGLTNNRSLSVGTSSALLCRYHTYGSRNGRTPPRRSSVEASWFCKDMNDTVVNSMYKWCMFVLRQRAPKYSIICLRHQIASLPQAPESVNRNTHWDIEQHLIASAVAATPFPVDKYGRISQCHIYLQRKETMHDCFHNTLFKIRYLHIVIDSSSV